MIQNQNVLKSQNGDNVLMYVNKTFMDGVAKTHQGVWEKSSISAWYNEDPNNNHLGLMQFWGDQKTVNYKATNIVRDLTMKKDVLEVNGWDGELTYDRPIYDCTKKCYVSRDTSNQLNPGIDGDSFLLVLNRPYTHGDVLTANEEFGQSVIVTEDAPVVAVAEGYEHMVTLVDTDKSTSYDASHLQRGVSYKKIGHYILGERGTNFSNVELPDTVGTIKCTFRLGAFSGVEEYITGKADSTNFRGGDVKSKEYLKQLSDMYGEDNTYAILAPLVNTPKGKKVDFDNMKLGATVQMLVLKELERITNNRLMWAQAGQYQGSNGVARLNEGLWRQLRRGKIDTYSRPGGITKEHIASLVNYIFKTNPNLPVDQRRIKLKCGKLAYNNILHIFKEEVLAQLPSLAPFLGSDALIKGVVTGTDLKNLKLNQVKFTGVELPGIGMVDIEHDMTLDYSDLDRFERGVHTENMAHSAYSVIVWDADSQEYSNNKTVPQGAKVIEGGNMKANIHLVKPQGEMVYWGTTRGRYDHQKASDIQSGGAIKQIGQEFWAFQIADILVTDPERFAMLELDPAARKGFN